MNFFLLLDLREINNGSSIPQINNYTIEPVKIAFPKSLSRQRAIIDKLAAISLGTQHVEAIYQKKVDALEELKKSLLHQAFTGQL
jgi:type I restriction enzyme S subunit